MTNITTILAAYNLLNALHHHLSVHFIFILEASVDFLNNFDYTNLLRDLDSGLNKLLIVSLFEGHSPDPKVIEKLLEDIFPYVVCLHSIATDYLFENFEDNLPELLFIGAKLLNDGWHDTLCVLCGVFWVHERNDEANCLEVCS